MLKLKDGIEQPNAPREFQLRYYPKGTKIAQDAELIEFIFSSGFTNVTCVGDSSFILNEVNLKVVNDNAEFCMFFQFKPYRFDHLVDHVNQVITNNMGDKGIMYLSIDRNEAIPIGYDTSLPDDYDLAIYEFVKNRVAGKVVKYIPCGYDGGDKFNRIHPLTRFYIEVTK